MVTGVVAAFEANNIPVNEPGDVADTLSHILVQPINGQALYVSGGKTYEIEERLEEVKPLWLGKQLFEELTAGQAILQMVCAMPVYHPSDKSLPFFNRRVQVGRNASDAKNNSMCTCNVNIISMIVM